MNQKTIMRDTMNGFGRFLESRLKEVNMSQSELARRVGVTRSIVSRWVSGKARPSLGVCIKIAQVLNVEPTKILYFFGYITPLRPGTIRVRVLSAELPCGIPRECLDTYTEEIIEVPSEFVDSSPNLEYYAVRARGNSMMLKGIMDGYLVIFSPELEVKHGDIAVVWINGKICAKTVLYGDNSIILQSANPAYEAIVVGKEDEFRIIGKVVGVYGNPNKVISDWY